MKSEALNSRYGSITTADECMETDGWGIPATQTEMRVFRRSHTKILENDLITRIQLPNSQHMLSAVIWISLEYTGPVCALEVDLFCSASLAVRTLAVQGSCLF